MALTISLDAMGGDYGPSVVVPAAVTVSNENPDLHLVLVGQKQILEAALNKEVGAAKNRIRILHASQEIAMDESPSAALRQKKDSSMRVAINLVRDGEAQACVSAGNSGALMATARFVLKTIPGIDRPAMISTLPTMNGQTQMLDLGANVDSSAEQLFQFAVMGSVLTAAISGKPSPTIGLLNIGSEEIKGNEQVKQAALLLAESHLNYVGFIEGDDIAKGTVDVVVCDGFVGNVALKTTEGVAKMIAHFMKQEFSRNFLTRLSGALVLPVLNGLKKRIDPRRYNGATFIGLRGTVVKSHGGADQLAFVTAIREAIAEVEKAIPELIGQQLETILKERRSA